MTTAIGSGLGATLGFQKESTFNTFATPTHFVTFTKEGFKLKKNIVQSHALHGGLYDLATRRAYTTHTVDGSIDMDLYDRGQGLLWAQSLGGTYPTPTQMGTTSTYYSVYTPGDTFGDSLSIQFARPFTSSTVQAFSYAGCKIVDWELGVQTSQQASLNFTFDGASEATGTTYTAASYTASNMLHFAEASLILGGTIAAAGTVLTISTVTTANPGVVTTSAPHGLVTGDIVTIASVGGATQANGTWPVTVVDTTHFQIPVNVTGTYTSGGTATTVAMTVGGGTSLPVAKSITVKGTNAYATDRFFLGTNGVKAEQLANGFRGITGTLDTEFENLTDIYNQFIIDSAVALRLTFIGPTIYNSGTGLAGQTIGSQVTVLMPNVYWDDPGAPMVEGPQVLHTATNYTALDPGTGNPAIQVQSISLDSAL